MPFPYICLQCNTLVVRDKRSKSRRVFCSMQCRSKYDISIRPVVVCRQCGKETRQSPSKQKRGAQYCSRECYLKSIQTIEVSKTCPVCNKTYSVPASIQGRFKVCSRSCRLASTLYVECERCGKRFTGKREQVRRFCSEECRRPTELLPCATCGTLFRKQPKGTRQFCCFACYRRFRGENRLERRLRKKLEGLKTNFYQEVLFGRYSVDFLLPLTRTAVEADGAYWHQNKERDDRKTEYLQSRGWRVVRLSERDVMDKGFTKSQLRQLITPPLLLETRTSTVYSTVL